MVRHLFGLMFFKGWLQPRRARADYDMQRVLATRNPREAA